MSRNEPPLAETIQPVDRMRQTFPGLVATSRYQMRATYTLPPFVMRKTTCLDLFPNGAFLLPLCCDYNERSRTSPVG
jgi:hypothetical protein